MNWEDSQIMNRGAPVVNYGDSAAEEFSITLKFFATGSSDSIGSAVRGLLDLTRPTKPGISPPSRVRITYRPLYVDFLCVTQSVSIVGPETLHWSSQGEPMDQSVQLAFREIDVSNEGPRGGGGLTYVPFGGV